ncbi:MAG: hypothetical protein K0Q46_5746 [Rhodococcus erythropolis]|jgi:hypothetical protein|nr:hypothetical protein N601_21295 [Rhodococcus erythropolis DN1]ERB52334.1 hypothetical protein N806_14270 [Rhodococcus sp. P27]MCS4254904.1 hypothetical protein [Rhodococcus erythropolis]OQM78678.1 hypothetical protein B0E55_05408 [Rhodococcus sp. 66b]MCW2295719.1 hypothetical protein [Rhodococcus erythropolis]
MLGSLFSISSEIGVPSVDALFEAARTIIGAIFGLS